MTVIPVLSRNTVMSLAHRGTVPHHCLDFFFIVITNNFVQLEDTKIKTERCCSKQRTEQTTVLHHSIVAAFPTRFRHMINFTEYNAKVGNSGAIWTGAGSLTISRSRRPFRTAYLRFILIEHQYSLHSDRYARAAWDVWTSASFYLRCLSTLTACAAKLRAG